MLHKNNIKDIYPLTPMQEGMYFHSLLEKNSPIYFEQFSYSIKGNLQINEVRQAILELFKRYDILRTVFVQKSSKRTIQVVLKEVEPEIYIEDISKTDEKESFLKSYKKKDRLRSFDLGKEVPFRISLFKTSKDEYEFIWSFHHILMDGWCTGILVAEFNETYRSFLEDRAPNIPKCFPYANYIKWIEKRDRQVDLQFWEKYLEGYERTASFPKKKAVKDYKKQQFHFSLKEDLTKRLLDFCSTYQITFNSIFQSTWALLLSMYNNSNDVVFGSVVSGRPSELEGVESMVGLFINTIPVRVNLEGLETVPQLWKRVQKEAIHTRPYHYCSLAEIQNKSIPGNHLFDHILVFENYPIAERLEGLGELDSKEESIDFEVVGFKVFEQTNYDLNVIITQQDKLSITFDYNAEVFNEQFIETLSSHFTRLIKQIAYQPETPIKALTILSKSESTSIEKLLDNIDISYPNNSTIDEIFDGVALEQPDRIALVFGDCHITYGILNQKVTDLAIELQKAGVGPDQIVGVLLDRSIEMIVALLGVLKAGGCYLPLSIDLPDNRINFLLEDSNADVLVSSKKSANRIKKDLIVIDIDNITKDAQDELIRQHQPNHLAYIIYTSGTTGNPKGVLISHRNVVRLLFNEMFQFSFSSNDIWTLFHSYSFDFSVWEMFGAILYGARLVIIPKKVVLDPHLFADLIIKEEVTVLNQTPTSFYNVMNSLLFLKTEQLSLQYVIFGGEALRTAKLLEWYNQYPEVQLINMFGITETTVHVTYKEIGIQEIIEGVSNIGKPIPTMSAYILDDALRIMPRGVAGELFVGGAGLTRGYLNNEKLTAQKFVESPFDKREKLYKTGDLARILPNGDLEYLGRKDHQVQLRGFRIELGEIQNQLLKLDSIEDVIVIARNNNLGEMSLYAYFIPNKPDIKTSTLRTALGKVLPNYMVPAYFIEVEKFDLTSNGKIDRRKLPDIAAVNHISFEAPQSDLEKKLAELWQQIIERKKISLDDDFFLVGGDSIKAVRLIGAINHNFAANLGVADLYEHSTLKKLAQRIKLQINLGWKEEILQIENEFKSLREEVLKRFSVHDQTDIEDIFPISDIEQGMLFHSIKDGRYTATYHDQFVYQLSLPNFNFEAFKNAFSLLVNKHEIFRTGFNLTDFVKPIQIVYKNVAFNIDYIKLDTKRSQEQVDFIRNFMLKDREKPFNIYKPPLFRAAIFQISKDRVVFAWIFHHVILDGWSNASFLTELNNTYLKVKNQLTPSLSKLKCSYKDYVVEQTLRKKDKSIQSYWRNYLSEIKRFRPFSKKPQLKTADNLKSLRLKLPIQTLDRLNLLSSQFNVPISHILFCAYAYMITSVSFEEEVVVGLVSNDRPPKRDGDKVLGCFLNTLPVVVSKLKGQNWIEYLELINDQLNEIKKYGGLSLYEIANLVGEKAIGQNPFFDALFNYVDFHIYHDISAVENQSDENDLDIEGFENTNTLFDFTINATGSQLLVRAVFDINYLPLKEAETLINQFQEALNQLTTIVHNQGSKLFPETIKREIVDESKVGFPETETIISLFKKVVNLHPKSTAIVCEERQLTYEMLDQLSDQLAFELQIKGIKNESIVALLTERSVELVISILAVLKSGGIYLPISPELPTKRIDYLLKDSNAQLLIQFTDKTIPKIDLLETIDLENFSWKPANKQFESLVDPNAGAYIIYTSGTTGLPKGVLVTHRNVVRLLFNDRSLFDFNASDVWTLFHSYNFDFSVWEMYGALLNGGKLIIVPKSVAISPVLFRALLKDHQVTILNQTPSAFYNLINEEEKHPADLALRYVIFGGEALAPIQLKMWYDRYPRTKLINMYGITETTVHVTYKEIGVHEITHNECNIGHPIPTTNVVIMDAQLNPLPNLMVGELCVSGEGLSRGYLNRPGLSQERFVENNNKRYYRSGDFARVLPNGELEYLGRMDNQVQVRGFRIELGEIEYQLLQHPKIKGVSVLTRSDQKEEKSIYAYYTTRYKIEKADIRSYLEQHLQAYMIPNFFVEIDSFPLTPNGKLDRSLLPIPRHYAEAEMLKPKDQVEVDVLKIWQTILKNKGISVVDNFFNVGGDSIKAIRLLSTINQHFKANLKIADIYKNESVRKLANQIRSEDGINEKSLLKVRQQFSDIKARILADDNLRDKENVEDIYLMSDIQQGMIFHSLENPEKSVYHDQMVHQVRYEDFDMNKFELALGKVVQKHELLRAALDYERFQIPVVIVYKYLDPKISYINLSGKVKEEQEKIISEAIEADRSKPFKFNQAPLWRMQVFSLDAHNILLLFVCHHAILDGWSDASFNTELHNTYLSLVTGQKVVLQPLECSYKDFVVEQIALKEDEKARKFWAAELGGFKRINFFNENKKKNQKEPIDLFRKDLGSDIIDRLDKVAKQHQVSPKIISFAAYLYMLNMLSYDNDIVTGYVSNKRPVRKDAEKVLGCFLNTTPFRMQFAPNQTWTEILKQVNEKANNIKNYEGVTLFDIVQIIGEHSRGKNPIFDSLFNYMDFHVYHGAIDTKQVLDQSKNYHQELNVEGRLTTNTSFDFSINVTSGTYIISISYNENWISRSNVIRLTDYFIKILDQFMNAPAQKANKGHIISNAELAELAKLAPKEASYPDSLTLTEAFLKQVEIHPDRIALTFKDKSLSYSELNIQSDYLAAKLNKLGIGRGKVVALLFDRSFEMVIGILGVLKAGGCYLPIDPNLPEERIRFMLKDGNAACFLIHSNEKPVLNLDILTVEMGEGFQNLDDKSLTISNNVTADDLAYIIYTSGTTSNPKGVMISHRNVIRLFYADTFQYSISSKDVWSQYHNYNFDVSVWEFFGSLLFGGTCALISHEEYQNISEFLKVLKRQKVTVLSQVPSVFYHLSNEELALESAHLKHLRYVVFGGEELNVKKLRSWMQKYPKVNLINMYGITETTVHATFKQLTLNDTLRDVSNIGTPIPTLGFYIVDNQKQLLPKNVKGELYVSGPGLSRGYLNRPKLTNDRFTQLNHIEPTPRVYKSGDLARLLDNGDMEYLGRIDHQIQLHGFRIELREIENKLLSHEDIIEAVVLADTSKNDDISLKAYYVAANDLEVAALKAYLRQYLPYYMVPSGFRRIDSIPVTRNGKLDKRALNKLGVRGEVQLIPPKDDMERKIMRIWSEVLGIQIDSFGVNSDFFELGGHSLKAMTVISRIHREFNLDITLKFFLSKPSIQAISTELKKANKQKLSSIIPAERSAYYPLSSAQRRLFVLQQRNADNTGYNVPRVFDMKGDWDIQKMERAFEALIERHEILRTFFRLQDGSPVQVVQDQIEFQIERVGNKNYPLYSDTNSLVHTIIKPFDLEKAPLFRACWIPINAEDAYLFLDFHHIITDGVSLRHFDREFIQLYNDKSLPPVKLQYKDYAVHENKNLLGIDRAVAIEFWRKELDGAQFGLDLPFDYYKKKDRDRAGEMFTGVIDLDVTRQLEDIARHAGATLAMVLLSVFKVVLSKIVKSEDITLGMVIAQRDHPDLYELQGLLLNTLPIRNYPAKDLSFTAFMNQAKQNMLNAIQYQYYFDEQLLDEMETEQVLQINDGFNVLYTMHNLEQTNEVDESDLMPDQTISTLQFTQNKVIADLTFTARKQKDSILIVFQYDIGLFAPETIERIYKYFRNAIETITEKPNITIGAIQITEEFVTTESGFSSVESGDFNF